MTATALKYLEIVDKHPEVLSRSEMMLMQPLISSPRWLMELLDKTTCCCHHRDMIERKLDEL